MEILESQILNLLNCYDFNDFLQALAKACAIQMQEKRCQRNKDLWKERAVAILDFSESIILDRIEEESQARLAALKQLTVR